MLYASASRALACLETIVHLERVVPLPLNRYLVEILIPGEVWETRRTIEPDDAREVGWDAMPPGRLSIRRGTDWARSSACCVLQVPSIVVPEESNVLVNPRHSDMQRISIRKVRRWSYDSRLRHA